MIVPTLTDKLVFTGVVAATAALVVNAALRPESQMFGRTIIAGKDPAEVALTYDDGPNEAATFDLLEVLARHNARATFFMIGRFVRQRPDIVRKVQSAGHLIGNHTMNHPWLAWKSARLIREELRSCSCELEDVLGAPVNYFRAPHGARRPVVLRAARELNMKVVQWNVMGYDWDPITSDQILANIDEGMCRSRRHHLGSNILLHDGCDRSMGADRMNTVATTERLLQRMAAQGQRAVTIDTWG